MRIALTLCALFIATVAFADAALTIPDVRVVDQDGRALHFYRDLVAGKTVAISFVFTSCTTICTPLGTRMTALQPLLKGRDDVRLISVTIDPATDTPQRLKQWSAKFGPRPRWTLVSGEKPEIEKLLKALRAYSGDPSSHSPLMLVGNDTTGRWTRVNGLQPAEKILAAIDEVRGPGGRSEGAGRRRKGGDPVSVHLRPSPAPRALLPAPLSTTAKEARK